MKAPKRIGIVMGAPSRIGHIKDLMTDDANELARLAYTVTDAGLKRWPFPAPAIRDLLVELIAVWVTVNLPETDSSSSASVVLAMLTVALSLSAIVTVAVSAPPRWWSRSRAN